jgi:hypothetical protein
VIPHQGTFVLQPRSLRVSLKPMLGAPGHRLRHSTQPPRAGAGLDITLLNVLCVYAKLWHKRILTRGGLLDIIDELHLSLFVLVCAN